MQVPSSTPMVQGTFHPSKKKLYGDNLYLDAVIKPLSALATAQCRHRRHGLHASCAMRRDAAVEKGETGSRVSMGQKLTSQMILSTLVVETRVAKLQMCFAALDADKSGWVHTHCLH